MAGMLGKLTRIRHSPITELKRKRYIMNNYKALLYTGKTDTEDYKHHLFAVVGAIMLPDLVYLPNPTTMQNPHTLEEVRHETERLTSVRTNGNGVVEWVEVDSYEAFKREWLNLVGYEFK